MVLLLSEPPGTAEETRCRPGDAFQLAPVSGGRHSAQERRDVAEQRQACDLELRHVAPEFRALAVPARALEEVVGPRLRDAGGAVGAGG